MATGTWAKLPPAKQDRVLRAAMNEFGRRGFSAGSLNAIAREADVAKGSLFQYFDSKLDLYATVCSHLSEQIQDAVTAGVDPDGDEPFFTVLRRIVGNWLTYFRRHPECRAVAVAVNNEMDPEARAAVRSVANSRYVEALRPLVKKAVDRGELRPDADPDQLIAIVILLLRHLDSAPFYPHLDPILGLYEKSAREVRAVAMQLVDVLERAYAAEL